MAQAKFESPSTQSMDHARQFIEVTFIIPVETYHTIENKKNNDNNSKKKTIVARDTHHPLRLHLPPF